VTTAIQDATNKPSVISISYGWPEILKTGEIYDWSPGAINAIHTTFQEAAMMRVTVLASSGDHGSSCGFPQPPNARVEYPGSDPYVTSVGGTTISNVSAASFTEDTWKDSDVWLTGGGISDIFYPPNFQLPPWQNWVIIPRSINPDHHIARGIPDIAGNASGESGYTLFQNGVNIGSVGGTSAAAPLYAALVALMNASLGKLGWLNPQLYSHLGSPVFRDISDGVSNASFGAPGYTAGPGWDACTGLGSVNGAALLQALTPTPESTICKQVAQNIRNVIFHNGPPYTVAGWNGVTSQLEQCVREGYLTQATVNALIAEYKNWLKTRSRPPRV
jgi:kumamolisin